MDQICGFGDRWTKFVILDTNGPSLNSDFTTWSCTKCFIALSFGIHLAGLFQGLEIPYVNISAWYIVGIQ